MITARFVTLYGVIGLLVMLILLGLIFFKQVPPSYYLPFSIAAFVLFAIRVVLRVLLVRQERRSSRSGGPSTPRAGQPHQ